ncbi:hypothetical protein BC943DRAFT_323361 [Umbelopsis sp. AD052]|nr:hypothetical protein BC943DRAFT_323361 [Umbelopsis sp. AD052]
MAASSGKLYVGHVSTRTTRRDLEELFEKYGRVQNVEIKHGGFAFVDYEDSRDADEAVRELNGHSLNGDRLIVEHSKKAGGEGSGCFLCGGTGHWARDCPDANERGMDVRSGRCFRCGQTGHLAKYCRGEPAYSGYRRRSPPPYGRRDYGYQRGGRSRSPVQYERSYPRSPPDYYRRERSRTPPRYGRSPSPDYYSRGRSRSPRGYGRSRSPYDREPLRRRSPYGGSRDYPPEDRSPLPNDMMERPPVDPRR